MSFGIVTAQKNEAKCWPVRIDLTAVPLGIRGGNWDWLGKATLESFRLLGKTNWKRKHSIIFFSITLLFRISSIRAFLKMGGTLRYPEFVILEWFVLLNGKPHHCWGPLLMLFSSSGEQLPGSQSYNSLERCGSTFSPWMMAIGGLQNPLFPDIPIFYGWVKSYSLTIFGGMNIH